MLSDFLKERIQTAYTTLLASKSLKPRYGQRLMIADVARTLGQAGDSDTPPVCVVEAGTGTGKTIAYTLAAIPVAQELEKTVVIATATVALQEQIVYKDLPDIQKHSGLDFTYALAKGRGRYLCLNKLDDVLQDSASAPVLALYPDEVAAQTDAQTVKVYQSMLDALGSGQWDGDRDAWADELDVSVWGRVTTDHAQCTGRRCANISQCAFFKAREQLARVDVVVTNHDLVLADLALGGGAILPDTEDCIFIFDEGHHLPDKAVNHFALFSRLHSTERWLEQGVKLLANAAKDLGAGGGIDRHLQPLPPVLESGRRYSAMIGNTVQALFDGITDARSEYFRFAQGLIPDEMREQAVELAAHFKTMLELLDNCCKILDEAMEDSHHPIARIDAEAWFPALSTLRSRAQGNYDLWADYGRGGEVEKPPRGRWITQVEGLGGQVDFDVYSSPILAASTLQRFLWSRCYAAVVTSATLTALGTFDRFAMRSGIPADAHCAVVPSPFDFAQAGELVVPRMDCDPGDADAHTAAVISLLPMIVDPRAGTLVLFASRRQLEQVLAGLPLEWREKVIAQGSHSKQEMIRQHREAVDAGKGSILFGLASFAEGVDLPGRYCTHVIIAKIPFAVPDQPLEAAIAEWIELRGGNAFMEMSVPDAALKLVQASGRLLRTESDRGRVTLLDRRILTRRYGRAMLDSLPPFKRLLDITPAVAVVDAP